MAVFLWLILLLGALRMGAVVFADPLMGYGNNGDFRRIQSCFGLWPQDVTTIAAGQHAQMPAARYSYDHPYMHDHCYLSSGLALFGAAVALDQLENAVTGDDAFDMRIMGALLWTLWVASACGLSWYAWRYGLSWLALLNALCFALVAADPFNVLYFNSFYSEAPSLLYGYWAIAAGVIAWCSTRYRTQWWLLVALCWLLFGTVKSQYMLHPALALAIMSFAACARGQWPARPALIALVAAALLSPLLMSQNMARTDQMRQFRETNLTNLYLGMVLGESEQPHRLAEELGLPRSCGDHAGKNRFHPDMLNGHLCPEIAQRSHADLLTVVAIEPLLVVRAVPEAVSLSQDWLAAKLGMVHGQDHQRPELPGVGQLAGMLPFTLFALWVAAACLISAVAAIALFGAAILAHPVPDWLAITALIGGMGHLSFAVSLLGDGYTDLARHNYCYQNMLAIGLVAAAVVLLRALSSAARPSAS